jgi:hypothetical protein
VTRPLEFPCRITNGRIPEATAKQLAAVIRNADGKQIVLGVREVKRTRSTSANAYLWGVVYPPIVAAFREYGTPIDAEDVHLFCKQHVGKLKQNLVTPDGEVLQAVGSTRHMTTTEFMDYTEAVRQFAAEKLGIEIPLPNEEVSQPTNEGEAA